MVFAIVGRASQVHKKPTAVASRGCLSKFRLFSTSAYGGGAYDDHQQFDLSDC